MPDLTIEQKWELLRTCAETLTNHAHSKYALPLRKDLVEVTNAVNMILDETQSHRSTAEQVAEIDRKIDLLDQQNLNLGNQIDHLSNLPHKTALDPADIASEISSNKGRIQKLQAKKDALTCGEPPA